MKPMGDYPADFQAEEGILRIGGTKATDLAEAEGTPSFVYDRAIIARRIAALRRTMPPKVQIHYAIKANPYRNLLKDIVSAADGFDVASEGEMRVALAAGMRADRISIAGPGKRNSELEAAISAGVTINLESAGEADRALAIAAELDIRPRLAVRVNPPFEIKGSGMRMGGGAKPFGVDADQAAALCRRVIAAGADWRGLHIFAGSQALDPQAIIAAQRATIELAGQLAEDIRATPPLVNLGGGFGIPYFPNERPLDIDAIGEALAAAIAARPPILAESGFALELGRWLVGEAGVYLTRVVDRKQSHGETFLVVDGGLHHQLAATGNFGTVVRRNYPVAVAHRFEAEPEETVTIVGCLCTPLDRLADRVALPRAEVGDVIAVFMAGAYGATASPQAFLGHPPPVEMMIGDAFGGLT